VNLNPVILSIPIFFTLIGIELVVERITNKKLYRLPDALANISCGTTSELTGLFLKVLAIGVYQFLFENYAFFKLDNSEWWYWVALILLVDFAYYWGHRFSHEVNVMWGGHVVHHQSEEYNLSVALRQSSFQTIWTFSFNLPIALLGFRTEDYIYIAAFNLLYQFWIHTETIGKLGWFEYIFNTPSHHRVHHGRNPKYIDKNHAGSLIIWDRMFGTFQEEEERPTYGITKPINSWNPVFANVSHYVEMSRDLKHIPGWKDKFRYFFKKPGWLPESLGGYRAAPEIDKTTYRKYNTPSSVTLNLYVLFQYTLCLGATSFFLFNAAKFTLGEKASIAALIAIVIVNVGVMFENRSWVKYSEWARIVIYPIILSVFVYLNSLPSWLYGIGFLYLIISAVWFNVINTQIRHVQATA
jgi:alkylglycerol monooxygenase